MTIEQEIQRMMELWYSIKPEAKGDLASLWEERRELGELEAIVEDVKPKVIRLLEVIPTLKRHSDEYRARTRDLIKLLHHFSKYKSSEEWVQKVTSDLDFISKEARKAIDEAVIVLKSRSAQAPPQTTEEEKAMLIRLWEGCYNIDLFQQKVGPYGYKVEVYRGHTGYLNKPPEVIDDIFIASKGGKNFLFPAYNVVGAPGLWMFYEVGKFGKQITSIKRLVEVKYDNKDNIWFPISGHKGILG